MILKQAEALREAEEFLKQFPILYPTKPSYGKRFVDTPLTS
jgi:hypothetical protein